jgi:hypothetical protein
MNAKRCHFAVELPLLAAFALLQLFDAPAAHSQPQGEAPAALLIYPRVEARSAQGIDTEIYIANTSEELPARVYCDYTSGVGHCSETGTPCHTDLSCLPAGQACVPACSQRDFLITLTPRQIVSWRASMGLPSLPTPSIGPPASGSVPLLESDPFIGELRCLQVDDQNRPVARNDLVGSAAVLGPQFSTASYEAISVRSTGTNDGDTTLCLGANPTGACTTAEYAECPDVLSVNHFFDGADMNGSSVENHLTLVPCSLFYVPRPGKPSPDYVSVDVTVTVVNEFDVQTSLPLTVTCFSDLDLSGIGAFSVATQGTLGGQTFLQSTQSDSAAGPGLVGILQQTFNTGSASSSSAHGLSSLDIAQHADEMRLPDF